MRHEAALIPSKGIVRLYWRDAGPNEEPQELDGVEDVFVRDGFIVLRQAVRGRKARKVSIIAAHAIEQVVFNERLTYAGVWSAED